MDRLEGFTSLLSECMRTSSSKNEPSGTYLVAEQEVNTSTAVVIIAWRKPFFILIAHKLSTKIVVFFRFRNKKCRKSAEFLIILK